MAAQQSQQDPRYGNMAPPVQQTHSPMPSSSQNYQPPSSTYSLPPQQPPQQPSPTPPQAQAQSPAATQSPADPLEQRVLDLLYPYRDECFNKDRDPTPTEERMALILCENIAFLIRHNQDGYGKNVEINDVSIASRNWQMMKDGHGAAGMGVYVNGNGYTHTVLRITVNNGESAINRFTSQVNGVLQTFFNDL